KRRTDAIVARVSTSVSSSPRNLATAPSGRVGGESSSSYSSSLTVTTAFGRKSLRKISTLASGASAKRTSSTVESSARVSGAGRHKGSATGGGFTLGAFTVASGRGSAATGGGLSAAARAGFGPSPPGSGGGFTMIFEESATA